MVSPTPTITISLAIDNSYARYPSVATTVTDEVIPAPPADRDSEAYADWEMEEILCFTGVGHTDGDSFYSVTVTACSDASLVGTVFEFGG